MEIFAKPSSTGLSQAQVTSLLAKYGYNEIPEKKEFRLLKIIFSQFASFLIIILIISGSISIFLGELVDGFAIFGIVLINAIIGFIQEFKAENAVAALKKMVVPEARVIRDGGEKIVPIRELVPGDIVLLSEGDKIPADLNILEAFSLKVDESTLTGESVPVNKTSKGTDKENLLFKGTLVVTGRATAVVLSTGINTEFGKIVHLVSKTEKTRSPLSIQLDNLGKKLGLVILVIISILFVIGYFRGISAFNMLMTSVALGVSAIPEGMPIIITLTLAIGVQILAREKAIVRKMNAIETLGATTIICSDKTGTLTLNEMTVKKIQVNYKEKEIPGQGYGFKEKISIDSAEEKKLLEIAENCNNAFLGKDIIGDPTEIALKVLARKAGSVSVYKKLDENVFTSERKMMSSLHEVGKEKHIFSKGAYEEILKKCTHLLIDGKIIKLGPEAKKKIEKTALAWANQALRVLAFAYKNHDGKFEEKDLIFVGLIGMIDPPRPTVAESIKLAKDAQIKIRIITGDNPITAKAIGEKIGLKTKKVLTGEEIDKMDDYQLLKAIYETEIFARTNPQHKFRIVDLLKRNKEVVAVTGDGVNDAPALKHADCGIAMGIKGTEATKEVADIVLKDDNFSTIINSIREGRRIYKNILAFVKYMLSANFGSLALVGIVTLAGFPMPLLPLQILWINIATDALPALALGKSKAKSNIMFEKPHAKNENIVKKFLKFIFIATAIQIIIYMIAYFFGREMDMAAGVDLNILPVASHARTLVFTAVVMFELGFAFICKEEKPVNLASLKSNPFLIVAVSISFVMQLCIIYLPPMQKIFKTVPLNYMEWLALFLICSMAFLAPYISDAIKFSRKESKK